MTARAAFRALLTGTGCVRPASVANPLAMRAAVAIGYELAMLGGSVASLEILGAPDLMAMTLSELAEQVRRITRGEVLPLMVDGDHGYGNALNVRRTIEEMEQAGAAAVSIEDSALPIAFGGGEALITRAEAAKKLRAALDARRDPAFAILGRTGANLVRDRDDLLSRVAAYEDAGADAIFVVGLRAIDELDALAAKARLPLILGRALDGLDIAGHAERGVRICLQGHTPIADAVAATYRRLYVQRHGSEPPAEPPADLVKRLSQVALWQQWIADYLA